MNTLACLALRLLTRRAIEGRTLAGAAVRDSEQGDIDTLLRDHGGDGTAPVISIYVDETGGAVSGRDLQSADMKVHLLIEVAIAAPVQSDAIAATAADPAAAQAAAAAAAPEAVEYEIPATSAGLEASLAIIGYQIKRALIDGGTVWSRLWCDFVGDVERVHTYRGADFKKTGVRYAAVQIEMVLSTLQDPAPGGALRDTWGEIVKAFEADDAFASYGRAIRDLVSGQPLPAWRRTMFEVGDTVEDAAFLGYGPLGAGAGDDTVPMQGATVDVLSPGSPPVALRIAEGQPGSFAE